MKTTNWYWVILNSIFLIVFNIFFFMLKGAEKHYESVWVSYGFIHWAYFTLMLTPLFIRKGTFAADYSRPLFLISSIYFLIVLIAGTAFIAIEPETSTAAWLTQIGLLGIFAAWFISNIIANEHTSNAVANHEKDLYYIKETSSQLKISLTQISDSKTKKRVEQLYDYVHSSPLKSSSTVFNIEQNIMNESKNLFNNIDINDNATIIQRTEKIMQMATERNRKLKLLN